MDLNDYRIPFSAFIVKGKLIYHAVRVTYILCEVEITVESTRHQNWAHIRVRDLLKPSSIIVAKPEFSCSLDQESTKVTVLHFAKWNIHKLNASDATDCIKDWNFKFDVKLFNFQVAQLCLFTLAIRLFAHDPAKSNITLFEAQHANFCLTLCVVVTHKAKKLHVGQVHDLLRLI